MLQIIYFKLIWFSVWKRSSRLNALEFFNMVDCKKQKFHNSYSRVLVLTMLVFAVKMTSIALSLHSATTPITQLFFNFRLKRFCERLHSVSTAFLSVQRKT